MNDLQKYRDILGVPVDVFPDENLQLIINLLTDIADVAIGFEMDRLSKIRDQDGTSEREEYSDIHQEHMAG